MARGLLLALSVVACGPGAGREERVQLPEGFAIPQGFALPPADLEPGFDLPLLLIEASGRVTVGDASFDLTREAEAGAFRESLQRIAQELGVDPLEGAGSSARPLRVLVDARTALEVARDTLVQTTFRGIGIAHLAFGVLDERGDLGWFGVRQYLEIGIVCGPDAREAEILGWSPEPGGAPWQLETDVELYPGMESGPTRRTRLDASNPIEAVLIRWAQHAPYPDVRTVPPGSATWGEYVELMELCASAGIAGLDGYRLDP